MNMGRTLGTFDFEPVYSYLEDEPATPAPPQVPTEEPAPEPELEPVPA